MPLWVHRTTAAVLRSVARADLPEPAANYIEDPDLSAVAGFDSRYWKISGDAVELQTAAERTATDAADVAARTTELRTLAAGAVDLREDPLGFQVRELIELGNKRDNAILNVVTELAARVQAMLDSSGGAENIRAAGRAVSVRTLSTRGKADAVQAFRDGIEAGDAD